MTLCLGSRPLRPLPLLPWVLLWPQKYLPCEALPCRAPHAGRPRKRCAAEARTLPCVLARPRQTSRTRTGGVSCCPAPAPTRGSWGRRFGLPSVPGRLLCLSHCCYRLAMPPGRTLCRGVLEGAEPEACWQGCTRQGGTRRVQLRCAGRCGEQRLPLWTQGRARDWAWGLGGSGAGAGVWTGAGRGTGPAAAA